MSSWCTQSIFPAIESGDIDPVRKLLDADPQLTHVRTASGDPDHFTPLQFAAAKGNLDICRLLIDRGAEVYTNPMSTRILEVLTRHGAGPRRSP